MSEEIIFFLLLVVEGKSFLLVVELEKFLLE
jgi:hypothetical protein